MKKLRLEIDELAVESFEVAKAPGEKGTVRGEQQTFTCQPETCIDYTCVGNGCPTFDPTCDQYVSCMNTCQTCNAVVNTCQFTCRYTFCEETACVSCPE